MVKSITNWEKSDPQAKREQKRYPNPIPSREFILQQLAHAEGPLSQSQIETIFGLEREEQKIAIARRLHAMVRDGEVVANRNRRYLPSEKSHLISGYVIGHRDGFGFVVPEEGGEDIYLPPAQMRMLMHGDRVLIRQAGTDRRGRAQGAVVDVLERGTQQLVGRLYREHGIVTVVPDNMRFHHNIMIPSGEDADARHGDIVTVTITHPPTTISQPQGQVIEVLGDPKDPGMEIEVVMRTYELPHIWPDAVQEAVRDLRPSVDKDECHGRVDLRHLPLVTIDGPDAQDFDDAVYVRREGKGWRLWVAIADVSHYVKPDSPLDEHARQRGNSVYFPSLVLPMLPVILSNELCSLRPDVDRLCMVCELEIGARGAIHGRKFYRGVMRSAARLTYDQVNEAISSSSAHPLGDRSALMESLQDLMKVYRLLRRSRERRGALDFDLPEQKPVLNEQGRIDGFESVIRHDVHRLVEECMIAANVAAGCFIRSARLACLFRVHESPPADALEELGAFLASIGIETSFGDDISADDFAKIVAEHSDDPRIHMIQMAILRTMTQAIYSPQHHGHFGLALPLYTHFTSPIRRYPDLIVHRAIGHIIDGTAKDEWIYDHHQIQHLGSHCSMTNRRADDATRDVMKRLKCLYMEDRVGQEFDGIISGVAAFGLFVELQNLYVEGRVHVTSLPNDYYQYDRSRQLLEGSSHGLKFCLGDAIRVRLRHVDLEAYQIDLEGLFPSTEVEEKPVKRKASRRRRRRSPKS